MTCEHKQEGFIEGKKCAPICLGDVLVLGLGKSGKAAVEYILDAARRNPKRVKSLSVAAGPSNEDAQIFIDSCRASAPQGFSFTVVFDTEDVAHAFPGTFDVCIASPGISQFSDFYQAAQKVSKEVISEPEFAWRESPQSTRWVAVTGTNGKTTVTSLIAHILQSCKLRAVAVGNIGEVCLKAVSENAADIYVAEMSSYQLASTRAFAPHVSVVLNITPDHLSWHQGMDNYIAAKYRVLENMACIPGACAVLDATNDIVRAKVRELKALDAQGEAPFDYIPLGTASGLYENMRERCGARNGAFVSADGHLVWDNEGTVHDFGQAESLQIKGEHNVSNALAAACAASCCGCADHDIAAALASFCALAHRIEPCGSVCGVMCYNDSKATNVDATLVALRAFAPGETIVLLGGRDKGTDLEELARTVVTHTAGAVCFGECAERFETALRNALQADAHLADFPLLLASGLAQAFECALSLAQPGNAVLLSPACASFDEFSCFEERGDVFKRLVAQAACAASGQEQNSQNDERGKASDGTSGISSEGECCS